MNFVGDSHMGRGLIAILGVKLMALGEVDCWVKTCCSNAMTRFERAITKACNS